MDQPAKLLLYVTLLQTSIFVQKIYFCKNFELKFLNLNIEKNRIFGLFLMFNLGQKLEFWLENSIIQNDFQWNNPDYFSILAQKFNFV